ETYRGLDLGLVPTIQQDPQNVSILKCQPFSSYPSQGAVPLAGRVHCCRGCAMESVALSRMPPFAGITLELRSFCACCLQPVTLEMRDGALVRDTPAPPLI